MTIHPLTPDRWGDLEKLFGHRGACSGCWCMFWRLPKSQFNRDRGEINHRSMKQIVSHGPPGLLAYQNGEPVGWVCVGPRTDFSTLERSRVLKPIDDQPVWSVVCFFIIKKARNQGISTALLQAAVDFARQQGAKIVEGYPSPARYGRLPDAFVYTGVESAFRQAGFREAVRRGTGRAIWRCYLE